MNKALAGYRGREKMSEGEEFEPNPDEIERRTIRGELASGIQYAMLPKKTRGERVNLVGQIHFGDQENLKGKVAAVRLMSSVLSRGTQQMTFQEFKDRLDELSATLTFSAEAGTLNFGLQTKRENFDQALELLKQALREPLLEEKELDVVRRQMINRMESMQSDPQGLAVNEFSRQTSPYPADDVRYSPTIEESIERLKAVDIDDVRQIHKDYLNGQHGEIAIVGDFDADDAAERLEAIFADWRSDLNYQRIERPAVTGVAGGREIIMTPDKQNAIYIAGLAIPMRDDDVDYEPMLVGNYILGGGPLASRLADRVRKQDGLSYGVGSQFMADAQDPRGMFMMFAISNPRNTEKVVATIDEELTRFVESGVTGEELEKAKASFLKTRQGRRAQDRGLARMLLNNLINDRTMDYQKESDLRISELSKEQVDNAYKQYLKKENLVIITAGDFEESETASGDSDKDSSEGENQN